MALQANGRGGMGLASRAQATPLKMGFFPNDHTCQTQRIIERAVRAMMR